MHLLNALARRCGRWSAGWLDIDNQRTGTDLAELDTA
jgi:hypothetical protein